MAKPGNRVKITLRCSECKQRNYNTNKNKRNTSKYSVFFFLSKTESLIRHSQTQFTPGTSKRIALIKVDCLLNHLSKVIFDLLIIRATPFSYAYYIIYASKSQ